MTQIRTKQLWLALCLFLPGVSPTLSWANGLLIQHNASPLQAESTSQALIPWETPIEGFFVRSHHPIPQTNKKWVLVVDGLVQKPLKLSLDDLQKMPQKSFHAVLQCSGNRRGQQVPPVPGVQWQKGAVGNAEWTGVSMAAILEMSGIQQGAKYATIEGADLPALPSVPKFVRSIPIEKMTQADTLLALKMNREPLPDLHGGPLRVILPNWYGENWMKWVTRIRLTAEEDPGFYMKKGYRVPKTPVQPGQKWDSTLGNAIEVLPVQSVITEPAPDATLSPGPVKISGKAFSGHGTIAQVEISLDDGKTWRNANLESAHASGGWQSFHSEIELKKGQTLTVLSKATDSRGNQQPRFSAWNPGGYQKNEVDSTTISAPLNPSHRLATSNAKDLVQRKCLICHSDGLIESQRLSKSQWESVLKKMETFGVGLSLDERNDLLKYLSQRGADSPRVEPLPLAYANLTTASTTQGNPIQGRIHFEKYCANCHGDSGEGKIGPRLLGKKIDEARYWSLVSTGGKTMPAFSNKLKRAELSDILVYLQN